MIANACQGPIYPIYANHLPTATRESFFSTAAMRLIALQADPNVTDQQGAIAIADIALRTYHHPLVI
jgi:hypothetical protein